MHKLIMAIKSSVVSISTNLLVRFPRKDFYVNKARTLWRRLTAYRIGSTKYIIANKCSRCNIFCAEYTILYRNNSVLILSLSIFIPQLITPLLPAFHLEFGGFEFLLEMYCRLCYSQFNKSGFS
jgi:hypothetical protein